MKYQTQKVAMLYFYGALTLFLAQVLFGLLAGTIYVLPNTLSVLLPFNIVRMIHTNALIVWSLIGFMGATYYPAAGGNRDRAVQPAAGKDPVLDVLRRGRRGRGRLSLPLP